VFQISLSIYPILENENRVEGHIPKQENVFFQKERWVISEKECGYFQEKNSEYKGKNSKNANNGSFRENQSETKFPKMDMKTILELHFRKRGKCFQKQISSIVCAVLKKTRHTRQVHGAWREVNRAQRSYLLARAS
jgi:hypothetical protein